MYYPLQIPNLLNKEFKQNIDYKEYHYKELENYIMCIWTMKSKHEINKTIYNTILPDGCIDLIINLEEKQCFFSGYSKATEYFELNGNINFIGIRFKPGVFYNIYKTDSNLIMDHMVQYKQIEKQLNIDSIFTMSNINQQLEILFNYLKQKTKFYKTNFFQNLIDEIYIDLSEQTIEKISTELSYSKRHINRLFYKNFGVNSKTLLNILRLHKSLNLLLYDNSNNLTQLAMKCGFCDQSHFIKEIKRYCGITPNELLKKYE